MKKEEKRGLGDNPANINPIQETLQKRAIRFEAFVRKTRDYYKNIIKGFQETVYQAERELREQYEKNSKLEDQKEHAIEQIIDERWDHGRLNSIIQGHWINRDIKYKEGADNTKYFNLRSAKFLDESHKDYEDDIENIRGLFEEWGLRIPNQWLPVEEAEERMWNEFDQSRCDAADFGPDDFDRFRFRIHPAYYKTDKVWKEELATIEEEKQRTKEADQTLARLKERDNEKS